MVKNLSAMQETQVPSLCWENPLEKGMATHSSILAWRIPWTEEILIIRLIIIITHNLEIKKLRISEAQKLIHVIS